LFVGQDIDPVVARMAYIGLSLLGCPGYIVIGNSFTQPTTGHPLFPKTDGDIWYTPFFFTNVWHWRKIAALMNMLCGSDEEQQDKKKDEVQNNGQ